MISSQEQELLVDETDLASLTFFCGEQFSGIGEKELNINKENDPVKWIHDLRGVLGKELLGLADLKLLCLTLC